MPTVYARRFDLKVTTFADAWMRSAVRQAIA